MDHIILLDEKMAHEYLSENGSNIKIVGYTQIDDHQLWRYWTEGDPLPRTRLEYWLRDDTQRFSIFGCFEHNLEQVIRGKVPGPNHSRQDDEK